MSHGTVLQSPVVENTPFFSRRIRSYSSTSISTKRRLRNKARPSTVSHKPQHTPSHLLGHRNAFHVNTNDVFDNNEDYVEDGDPSAGQSLSVLTSPAVVCRSGDRTARQAPGGAKFSSPRSSSLSPPSGSTCYLPSTVSLTLKNSGSVARDHLASERTFLAYMRTSLAIASSGVGALYRLNQRRITLANRLSHPQPLCNCLQ